MTLDFCAPQMGLVLKSDPRVLELEREPVISELGIFGTYVRSANYGR